MKDSFDKQFGDIEFISNTELTAETRNKKLSIASTNNAKQRINTPGFKAAQKRKKSLVKQKSWRESHNKGCDAFRKPVVTPKGTFDSMKSAADAYNIHTSSMQQKIQWHADEFYYVEDGPGVKITGKAWNIVTPFGEYRTAADFDTQTDFIFTEKRKSLPHLYYYKKDGPGEIKYENVTYTPYGIGNNRRKLMDAAIKAKDPGALSGSKDHNNWLKRMITLDPDNYYVKKEPKREWELE